MNIALPAIVLFLLVSPGILARYAYRKGNWKSPTKLDSIQNEIIYGLGWALFIHISLISTMTLANMIQNWLNLFFFDIPPVRFDTIVSLFMGWENLNESAIDDYFNSISNYLGHIISYFLIANILGFNLGLILHLLIRHFCLDIIFKGLRFNNPWYYLFSGEQLIIDRYEASKLLQNQPVGEKKYIGEEFYKLFNNTSSTIKKKIEELEDKELEHYANSEEFINLDDQIKSIKRLYEAGVSGQKKILILQDLDTYSKRLGQISIKLEELNKTIEQIKKELDLRFILYRPYNWNPFKKINTFIRILSKLKFIKKLFLENTPEAYLKISCLMHSGDKVYLYIGVLVDYTYKNGMLEKLILSNVFRAEIETLDRARNVFRTVERDLSNNSDDITDSSKSMSIDNWEECLEVIDGDYLIMNYDDIKNISVERSDHIFSQIQ